MNKPQVNAPNPTGWHHANGVDPLEEQLERGVYIEEELAARLEALKSEHPNAS